VFKFTLEPGQFAGGQGVHGMLRLFDVRGLGRHWEILHGIYGLGVWMDTAHPRFDWYAGYAGPLFRLPGRDYRGEVIRRLPARDGKAWKARQESRIFA
jgi:hypothetical protein